MKDILLLIIIFYLFQNIKAQSNGDLKDESNTNNSIWYIDATLGGSGAKGGGFLTGFSANYQVKKNLFTFRNIKNTTLNAGVTGGFPLFIPFVNLKSKTEEFSLLYGRRHIKRAFSYSYSAGISYSELKERLQNNSFKITNSVGFPLEFNVKWFKNKKSRYRIYELIPIGKPSTIGNSIGFKFLANVSKIPYVGIGLTIGIGKYKIYN